MTVDKNLFLYDLAIVSIVKNEGNYVKEWLDYHLAAGADHFYIYDRESSDDTKEILQPYIDKKIVTYVSYPDDKRQCEAYNEAYKEYRFFCRYMAFIDVDEFIFPQNKKSVIEVLDKFLKDNPDAGGLEINRMAYGSNFQETADYSKGVLERFTRRALTIEESFRTIANPRKIHYITNPYGMKYFDGVKSINNSNLSANYELSDKILINYYPIKSSEEYLKKMQLKQENSYYVEDFFAHSKYNDIPDESIVIYRNSREKNLKSKKYQIDYERLSSALIKNLSPMFNSDELPLEFFAGKMETFLTCLALSSYLKENALDKERGELVEKASLKGIHSTIFTELSSSDVELLLNELPNILKLNYSIVKDILAGCLQILEAIKNAVSSQIDSNSKIGLWKDFNDYDNLYRFLKALENYEHK